MKSLPLVAGLLCLSFSAVSNDYLDQARALSQRYIMVDGHIDVPYRLQEKWDDVTQATQSGDFDYPRAVAGGLNAPFMSIYIPPAKEATGEAKAMADVLIDQVEAIVYRAPNKFAIPHSVADVKQQFSEGKISLPMGMENGAPIQGDLANVQHFYDRGIRYITLAHSKANHISDSSYDSNKIWQGLSPFGLSLIDEMNNVGIMVDISHVSDAAYYQVLARTKVPVIASHSSARHFTPGFERNMDDDMTKALARNGGVIMINFGSSFISQTSLDFGNKKRAAISAFVEQQQTDRDSPRTQAFVAEYDKKFAYPYATVSDVADHIDHVVKLVGIDYVGLGSDYDGVGDTLPTNLKDVASYPNLIAELLRRKYTEQDIEKLLGANVLRVWQQVEDYARQH